MMEDENDEGCDALRSFELEERVLHIVVVKVHVLKVI